MLHPMRLRGSHMPQWFYKALMVLATAIWGLGTVVVKAAVGEVSPAWIVGFRFLAAGILLGVIMAPKLLHRLDGKHLMAGAVLGVLLFLSYGTNTLGLTDTSASNSAFLTTFYVVIIPLLNWVIAKVRPTRFTITAALLCMVGLGFVAYSGSSGFSLRFGDAVTLLSAFFLSLHVIMTAKLAPGCSVTVLTIVQFLVAGVMGFAFGAVTEPVPDFASFGAETWGNLIYLAVFASCLAILLQNVGVAHTEPAQASLFLSLESVFGVLFAVLFLGEMPSPAAYIGFGLIFCGIIFSEYIPLRFEKRKAVKAAAEEELQELEESESSMR